MISDVVQNPRLAAALAYADRGWHVFPVMAGTKGCDPITGRSTQCLAKGFLDASNDPETIRAWWRRWPDANICLNLAASGLLALDPDLYKPDCEWTSFVRGRDLPATLVQRTPRGGLHYIFRADPEARYPGKLCAGVDIKHNGYILLEPSTFEGGGYRFETDDEPAPVPDWIARGPNADGDVGQCDEKPVRAFESVHIDTGDHATAAEIEELLGWIDPDAGGYDAWIEILQAIHDHSGAGAEGLAIAEAWSQRGARFRPGEVAAKWRGFRSGRGITVKTLARRAQQNGADLSGIARRHRGRACGEGSDPHASEDRPDLSHDHLALDLGARSWDANARYVELWGKWLFWSGTHWRRDETLEHLTRTRAYLRVRAADLLTWTERRTAEGAAADPSGGGGRLKAWARNQGRVLRSSATVAAVGNLARANPSSAVRHDVFDADHLLIGTPGGTVDLRTGETRPARRADMISRLTACAPADPGVRPELWLRFLSEVLAGDEATIAFLQRAAGYALTGSTDEHKLLFLHGAGRNGKSVFLNTLQHIWGDYVRRVSATTFLNAQTERHPTDIAGLHGARLAIASELPRGKTWDEATIKDLTGGDRVTARFMRQDFFDFDPQMTLMIAGNTQPSFRGVDEAIRSRVVLVPFAVTIPPERRDRSLPEKLMAEAPAILRWCIEGARLWQERGLDVPPAIAAASAAYFDEEDTLGQFLEDETLSDPQAFVSSDDLIVRFNFWCDRQGLGNWTKRTLMKELKLRGFSDAKSNGRRGLRGLQLA